MISFVHWVVTLVVFEVSSNMTMEVPTSEVGFGALMVEVSLTASFPLKKWWFRAPIFRGELLNFGGVFLVVLAVCELEMFRLLAYLQKGPLMILMFTTAKHASNVDVKVIAAEKRRREASVD